MNKQEVLKEMRLMEGLEAQALLCPHCQAKLRQMQEIYLKDVKTDVKN